MGSGSQLKEQEKVGGGQELPHLEPGHGYEIDTRALMRTQHDQMHIFLVRLYASWELRLYYIISTAFAAVSIVSVLLTNSIYGSNR